MKYLSRKQILQVNRATIAEHGGNFVPPENILNADRLEYALDAVRSEVFGEKLFKTEAEIAAAYLFYLITGHVFSDGNKRTGLAAALIFLDLNDYALVESPSCGPLEIPEIPGESDEVYRLTYQLAAGRLNLDVVKAWFVRNTTPQSDR